jgi:hypothetical protein
VDAEILSYALDLMIKKRYVFTDAKGEPGYLTYVGNVYMFHPDNKESHRMTLNERESNTYLPIRKKLDISLYKTHTQKHPP